ncbi:hypothetical protein BJ085DRAFT_40633 [Dimargaris cristalligena]|uniref:Membrane anchor Opy2 N-terminal domain-containing protein n=1 Tax=Dimargaris cristalligena TaxID=215637 RepID=A0A4P9ZNM7_9FUNG|nr:hypothetical protein BJ085DRAFT_40633 [Dimargaris cristalligena]|eukprot:RKP34785.1 hypothetical protein BJ085DRAFT_40633 [Dimargaris cristalligena]
MPDLRRPPFAVSGRLEWLHRRDAEDPFNSPQCVDCSAQLVAVCPPCSANQKCVSATRTCDACATAVCVDINSEASNLPATVGISVGTIVGVILLFGIMLFLWRRYRSSANTQPPGASYPCSEHRPSCCLHANCGPGHWMEDKVGPNPSSDTLMLKGGPQDTNEKGPHLMNPTDTDSNHNSLGTSSEPMSPNVVIDRARVVRSSRASTSMLKPKQLDLSSMYSATSKDTAFSRAPSTMGRNSWSSDIGIEVPPINIARSGPEASQVSTPVTAVPVDMGGEEDRLGEEHRDSDQVSPQIFQFKRVNTLTRQASKREHRSRANSDQASVHSTNSGKGDDDSADTPGPVTQAIALADASRTDAPPPVSSDASNGTNASLATVTRPPACHLGPSYRTPSIESILSGSSQSIVPTASFYTPRSSPALDGSTSTILAMNTSPILQPLSYPRRSRAHSLLSTSPGAAATGPATLPSPGTAPPQSHSVTGATSFRGSTVGTDKSTTSSDDDTFFSTSLVSQVSFGTSIVTSHPIPLPFEGSGSGTDTSLSSLSAQPHLLDELPPVQSLSHLMSRGPSLTDVIADVISDLKPENSTAVKEGMAYRVTLKDTELQEPFNMPSHFSLADPFDDTQLFEESYESK